MTFLLLIISVYNCTCWFQKLPGLDSGHKQWVLILNSVFRKITTKTSPKVPVTTSGPNTFFRSWTNGPSTSTRSPPAPPAPRCGAPRNSAEARSCGGTRRGRPRCRLAAGMGEELLGKQATKKERTIEKPGRCYKKMIGKMLVGPCLMYIITGGEGGVGQNLDTSNITSSDIDVFGVTHRQLTRRPGPFKTMRKTVTAGTEKSGLRDRGKSFRGDQPSITRGLITK